MGDRGLVRPRRDIEMTDRQGTDLPLSGYRVLDLSRILAGPYCTMILGDQGADVIKVERPGTGDDTRTWGPPFAGGESAYYLCCNRTKRSITVDLKNARGAELVRELARASDVLVENFTPGLTKRFGLDYETLREENPGLVYCSITAYGGDGPYRDRPGYDMVLSAVGGLMWITGERDGDPCKVGVAITDVLTGVYASGAITAALSRRWPTSAATTWSPVRRPPVGARPTSRSFPTRCSERRIDRSPSPWRTTSCGSTSAS
jgi:crotonobetainyl-CoA:carnitine CoA-transferase CaiB-like acyl-CoA transferase